MKNGELIDLRTEKEIMEENKVYNPKELEYWEIYFQLKQIVNWKNIELDGVKNPKYLKFKNL